MAAGALAVLGKLATDPVWGSLLAQMGTGLVNRFLGLGGQAPYEEANQARLQAGMSALPELQRAAAGLPTASSDALMRQVRREGTAMQQSMAASARGSGMLGGTPQGGPIYRAQSERIQAANQEALAQRLGQHQMQAQQTLMGQLQPAIQYGNLFANQDLQDEVSVKGSLGRLGRKFAENPNDQLVQRFIKVLAKLGMGDVLDTGGASTSTSGGFANQFSLSGSPPGNVPYRNRFRTPGLPAVGR